MCPESAPMDLALYRLEKAKEMLKDAELLFKADQWSSANNRAYYCIFHGMRAMLALKQMDFKKHSGVIAFFNKEFIHGGTFPKEYLTVINNASIIRNNSDYDDFYICSRQETEELIADAKKFIAEVAAYLGKSKA